MALSDYEPRLYLDRENRKMIGLCAGLADSAGMPVTAVRIGAVVLSLTTFPPLILLYFLASFFLPAKPRMRPVVGAQLQPGSVARLAIELNEQGQAVLVPQIVGPVAAAPSPNDSPLDRAMDRSMGRRGDPIATARLKIDALARYDALMARMNAVEAYITTANIGLSAQIDRLPLQHGRGLIAPMPAKTIDELLDMQQLQALARSGPPRTFGRAAPRA